MSKNNKKITTLDCGTKVTPFNIKKALRGGDVVSRAGDVITQLHFFNVNDMLIAGACDDGLKTWYYDGCFFQDKSESLNDIFMVYKEKPKKDKVKNKDNKKTKRWLNIYEENECSDLYESKKEAEENIPDYVDLIKTIKIKF